MNLSQAVPTQSELATVHDSAPGIHAVLVIAAPDLDDGIFQRLPYRGIGI